MKTFDFESILVLHYTKWRPTCIWNYFLGYGYFHEMIYNYRQGNHLDVSQHTEPSSCFVITVLSWLVLLQKQIQIFRFVIPLWFIPLVLFPCDVSTDTDFYVNNSFGNNPVMYTRHVNSTDFRRSLPLI